MDSTGPMISGSGRTPSRKLTCPLLDLPCQNSLTRYFYRYWLFLAYFVAIVAVLHLTPLSGSETYIGFLGAVGLAVEATLPLPQILANHRSGSCKGFRLSVLAAWIIGDTMKMSYFFCSQDTIPWAFKICGMFQCVCDLYLGFQYWTFTRDSGPAAGSSIEQEGRWGQEEKDIRMN